MKHKLQPHQRHFRDLPRKNGIWLGRKAKSSLKSGFTSLNPFDILTKEDRKCILRDLHESDKDADVENGSDLIDNFVASKSLGNSTGGNTLNLVLVLCGYCWCFVVKVCAWFKNIKFVLDSGGRGDKTKKKHSCVVDHQVGVQVNHDVSIEDIMCAKVSNDDHVSVNKEDICSFAAKVGTDASVGLANEGSGTSATVHESYTTNNYALIHSRPISYAKLVTGEPSRKNVNFCTLITPVGNRPDVVIPLESFRAISERFANKAYGFFLGKWMAYPFSSKDGLDAIMENGPWFIHNNPFILQNWNLNVTLQKKDVGNVPVWVKLHGVLMMTFSDDGLSIIATKLGTPLMRDSYTSDICMQSWGKKSYARAMIEPQADEELEDTIVVKFHGVPMMAFSENSLSIIATKLGPRYARAMIEPRADEALKDTIVVAIPILIGEGFNMIDKFERQMIEGKFLLVDDDGKPLPNVVSTVNANSDSEVEEVFDEHATFMASTGLKRSSDSSYGTNSLWEQWRETKQDDNYDPYVYVCTMSSLEDIPKINTTKIEYLYAKEHNIQEKIKFKI
ncbi:putative RNA-directed DNA polymerase, eukaryota, reverse transcriptase zinc-binding domain protein [Tanacetum coccineum]